MLLVACLFLVAMAGQAYAQLNAADIEALRRRGRAEGWTFIVSQNEATGYPLRSLCGAVEPPDWRSKGRWDACNPRQALPSSFDWRNYGACTPIRNQFSCGSCWAFAAIGTVESYLLIARGLNLDISEQWLVSCTTAGNCIDGGWHYNAYEFLRCNGSQDPCGGNGVVLESKFPYVAMDVPCSCPYPHPYCIPDWALIGPQWGIAEVGPIKQAILDHGPVSVCVYADDAFQAYGGGVFNACTEAEIDHVVVLIGWDDSLGANGAWLMRNSWGPNWGEGGHMWIEYGCSMIGYAACYLDYVAETGSTTLPFSDSFVSPTIDRSKWIGVSGAEVNDLGIDAPTPPYSLNLNGSESGGDSIRSATMDTANFADIIVSYQWERKGNGDAPEPGDDLILEYYDPDLNWIEFARQPGDGPAMTAFSTATHTLLRSVNLPAFHGRFRVQFRVASTDVDADDYFIDNVSITTTTDQLPPTGLQWAHLPTTISTTAVTMSASAQDPSGVDYLFNASGIGSHTSGWQAEQTYTDTQLQVNRTYSYKVKARDRAQPINNETPFTSVVTVVTFIETPTALSFGPLTNHSIQVTAPGTFTRLTSNRSGLYFEALDPAGNPVGGAQANTWVQTQSITATGLTPGTAYRFRVKARNYFGNDETPWYPAGGYKKLCIPAHTGPIGLPMELDVSDSVQLGREAAPNAR
jgi:hypothetical protein